MGIMLTLSGIALRQIAEQVLQRVGVSGGGEAIAFLTNRFTDHSQKLTQALQTANARAWESVEVALAGDSLWDRCKVALARAEDQAFRTQVRAFLEESPLRRVRADHHPALRQALKELRSARARGALTNGSLAPAHLAQQANHFARHDSPQAVLEAELAGVERIAGELRGSCPNLFRVLVTRQLSPNILVVAVRYHFRRQIETDDVLFRGLAIDILGKLQENQERAFAGLTEALSQQRQRLESMLGEVVGALEGIIATTQETNAGVRELKEQMQQLLKQLQFQNREVRPSDSLSLRSEGERQLVKSLVVKYRSLSQEERQQRPSLLSDIGKLGVASGDFEAAQRDFEALAALEAEPKARAEAYHNAYRAALERRRWDEALKALLQAAELDAERFAPFPLARYVPQRILGAGGFGVVFLCHHQLRSTPVVVKSLSAAEQGRDIKEVFAEAEALDRLDHPGIIRVGERDYADAARTRPYLVMDYFDGKNLADHVREHGELSEVDLRAVARQVAEALHAAHASKILHRDVKPANVLVRRDDSAWKVKLIDFGLAVPISATAAATAAAEKTLLGASVAGTRGFAAPEQLGERPGESASQASDIYGFAKTCCFALFRTTDLLRSDWAKLPHQLCDLLEQCLKPNPKDRPTNFAEVLERLAPRPPGPEPRPPAPPRPGLELQGSDAAALDDLCAADALAKKTAEFQRKKKALVVKSARAREVQLWFDAKARPENSSMRTASSQANLVIKNGNAPVIPPQPDGTPTPIKAWLMEQGLDEGLAGLIAAREAPQTVTTTELVGFAQLLAGTPEQQAVARKLAGRLFEQLLPHIASVQFADGGERLRTLLGEHFSPDEQRLLQETTTTTVLPDFLDRAASYCTTLEQLDQLLNLLSATFYVSHMKYKGPDERVIEALLRQ